MEEVNRLRRTALPGTAGRTLLWRLSPYSSPHECRFHLGFSLVTTNLPFDEWTEVVGSDRLTGALLDRLTHHVHILEMNGDSCRLRHSRQNAAYQVSDEAEDS